MLPRRKCPRPRKSSHYVSRVTQDAPVLHCAFDGGGSRFTTEITICHLTFACQNSAKASVCARGPMNPQTEIVPADISPLIRSIRGARVLLDTDLAKIYCVETRSLNQALKRNQERFPEDFAFELTRD